VNWHPGDRDEEIIKCSNARWQEISGTLYATKKSATWLKANQGIFKEQCRRLVVSLWKPPLGNFLGKPG